MDLYVKLYYEPVDEEYEETKYFIKDCDKKLVQMLAEQGVKQGGTKKVTEIRLK